MNKTTEQELADIIHLFYVKHELRDAGITFEGLSNRAILELYNTFFGSRYNPRQEGEQRSRRIESNANNRNKPKDEAINLESHCTVDQSANPGDGDTGDQSTNPEIDGPSSTLFSNGKEKDNFIDVNNSVANYLIPLDPAPTSSKYKAPPYCNKEYKYAMQEEKTDHLVNYHFMLKSEKEHYQSISEHQVRCASPTRSKIRKVDSNTNLIKSFKAIMTDLSYFKQNNEYQTYIFNINPNNFEPEPPHSPDDPDNIEDTCSDDQMDNIIPSPGNFGLNDLLNLAVIDDSPTTLSTWIDQQINAPSRSAPHRYQYEPSRDEAGPSRKRSLSPEDKNVKRHRAGPSTGRDDVPLLSNLCYMSPSGQHLAVGQTVQDSVRVVSGLSDIDMAVPGTSRGSTHGSNSPVDPYADFPYAICIYCHHWFEKNPNTKHFCSSPPYKAPYSPPYNTDSGSN